MCSMGGSRSFPSGREGSGRCPARRRLVAATGAEVRADPDDFPRPPQAPNAARAAADVAPARKSRLDRPSRSRTARQDRSPTEGARFALTPERATSLSRQTLTAAPVNCPPPPTHTPGSAVVEVRAEITANVWQVPASPGVAVGAGDTIAILESMKMEIPVEAPVAGLITEIRVAPNDQVNEGDLIALIQPS